MKFKFIIIIFFFSIACQAEDLYKISKSFSINTEKIKISVNKKDKNEIVQIILGALKSKGSDKKYFSDYYFNNFSKSMQSFFFNKEDYLAVRPIKIEYGRKAGTAVAKVQTYWFYEGWEGNMTQHYTMIKDKESWKIKTIIY